MIDITLVFLVTEGQYFCGFVVVEGLRKNGSRSADLETLHAAGKNRYYWNFHEITIQVLYHIWIWHSWIVYNLYNYITMIFHDIEQNMIWKEECIWT